MERLQKGIKILDNKRNIIYVLEKFIGEGSFGEVWLANNETNLQDKVAIKFYIPLDEAGRNLFLKEYESSSELNHPNLLASLFFGEWERRPYIGMKYCENGASSKYVGKLSPCINDEMLIWRFIRDTAAGLQFLHENEDLVHQDIKPDNILVGSDGGFVIMDFGISKKARATLRSQSKRSNSAGAPAYMAPERFTKSPSIIYASDIWSLGVSIYELATGELPFNGMGGGLLNAGAELPVLKDGWSKELNSIMQVCLSKETWDRKRAVDIKEFSEWILCGKHGTPPCEMCVTSKTTEGNNITNEESPDTARNGEYNNESHWLRNCLIAVLACVIFIIAFNILSKPYQEKLANYRYPYYLEMVERCQDSINIADKSNPNQLLATKVLLDSIKQCQDEYGQDYLPEQYNMFAVLDEQLSPKLKEASEIWADAAKRQYDATNDLNTSLRYSKLAVDLSETPKALSVYEYLSSKTAYMHISYIEFANSGDDNDFAKELNASTLTFLTPRISYTGLAKDKKEVKIDVKIIEPNGALSRGQNSPDNYSYDCTINVQPGQNSIILAGWGKEEAGSYYAGNYIIELWYQGNEIYSKRFRIN